MFLRRQCFTLICFGSQVIALCISGSFLWRNGSVLVGQMSRGDRSIRNISVLCLIFVMSARLILSNIVVGVISEFSCSEFTHLSE